MITAMPSSTVKADASVLLVFTGPPNRYVSWGLTGSGTLSIITQVTDASGVALAKYTPGTVGDTPTVTAAYAE